jgi:hypothetical protein
MNPFRRFAQSVGETLLHEVGRTAFGLALGAARGLLRTPKPQGVGSMALARAMQRGDPRPARCVSQPSAGGRALLR